MGFFLPKDQAPPKAGRPSRRHIPSRAEIQLEISLHASDVHPTVYNPPTYGSRERGSLINSKTRWILGEALESFAQWTDKVEIYARLGRAGVTTDNMIIQVAWLHMHADVFRFFETYASTVSTALMAADNASQHAAAPIFPPTSFSPLTWTMLKD